MTFFNLVLQFSKRTKCLYKMNNSSNGCHYGPIFFKSEKNLDFFRLKNWPIDDYPGRLE